MNKAAKLRALLQKPGMVVMPNVMTPEAAAIAEAVGFDLVYVSGAVVMSREFMFNDWGMMYPNEMVEIATRIARGTSLPLVSDADQGGETPLNTYRMTKAFIENDIAAAHFEDSTNPKKRLGEGTTDTRGLVSIDEMKARLQAVVEARKSAGRDFVIISRTDAIANHRDDDAATRKAALQEAIRRGNAFADAGADLFLADGAPLAEVTVLAKEVRIPIFAHTPATHAELREANIKLTVVLGTVSRLYPVFEAMLQYLKDTDDDTFAALELPEHKKYKRSYVDVDDYRRIGEAYVKARRKSCNYPA
jgi:2-methylisocitrate lyase-like PEP mutase family enzyme